MTIQSIYYVLGAPFNPKNLIAVLIDNDESYQSTVEDLCDDNEVSTESFKQYLRDELKPDHQRYNYYQNFFLENRDDLLQGYGEKVLNDLNIYEFTHDVVEANGLEFNCLLGIQVGELSIKSPKVTSHPNLNLMNLDGRKKELQNKLEKYGLSSKVSLYQVFNDCSCCS